MLYEVIAEDGVPEGHPDFLGEHRAMDLHGRQRQLGNDIGVLDGERLIDRLALEPLSGQASYNFV